MLPFDDNRNPYLCTYYVFMSLLVVALALSLIWYPCMQIIAELNTFITSLVIYIYIEVMGYSEDKFFNAVEGLLLSEKTLRILTVLCICFVLYLVSPDLLQYVGCYISRLPSTETFEKIKKLGLEIIDDLLSLTGSRGVPKYRKRVESEQREDV